MRAIPVVGENTNNGTEITELFRLNICRIVGVLHQLNKFV
jgi:hypothetical protein